MKLRRLFCCSLLFVFIFSVVFSVSAFAIDINGYDVTTSVYKGTDNYGGLIYDDFNTTIVQTATGSALSIKTNVAFPEALNDNAIFDFDLFIDYGSCSSISAQYLLKGSNNTSLGSGYIIIENKTLSLKDIVVDGGKLTGIEFDFTINNPTWQENMSTVSTVTDLTNTTWTLSKYSAPINEIKYNVSGRFNSPSTTYTFDAIKFLGGVGSVMLYRNGSSIGQFNLNGTQTVEFTGGSDVKNTSFISLLDIIGTMEGSSSSSNTTTVVTYSYNFAVTNVNANISDSGEQYSGIIGWIKNVFNSITNLPARIANAIGGLFTNLGNMLLDGIKGLFIPSEQDIIDIKAEFEEILEDRFGAVYESSKIVNDFANSLNSSASTSLIPSGDGSVSNYGSVSFPEVTVNLAGTPFSFGGWNVQLKYSGFEALYDALRLITNICATFMVINAMKSRMEGIIR